MSVWKEYKLSDLMQIIGGGTPKTNIPEYWNGGILWLSVADFNNSLKYCYRTEKSITERGLKESSTKILKKGQLIISARGTVGEIAMLGKDMAFNQSNYGIIANEKLTNNDYLYYLLKYNIPNFISNSYGAVFDTITKHTFSQILVKVPGNHEQKEISSVLNSLDDKIDLLHRQNKILEQLAETLFRQWFIEEANKKEQIKLGDYIDCINGYSYNSSELNPSDVALVTLKSFNRKGGFSTNGFKEFTGKIKLQHIVREGELVVAHTDITQEADVIGNPALIIENPKYKTLIITMDLVKVICKNNMFSIPFLYFLMRTPEFKYHCLGSSNGTTVLHLSKSAIPSFTFPKPDFEKIKLFTDQCNPLINKIIKNYSQLNTLSKLRDTLHPKLMCGEVEVKF